jgi:hypothetical protein
MKLKNRKSDYICSVCADEKGGVWPEGHAATMHSGICGLCGKTKTLANVGDWDWPDNKKIGMRD